MGPPNSDSVPPSRARRSLRGREGVPGPRMRGRLCPPGGVSAAPGPGGRRREQDGGASAAAGEPGGSARPAAPAARRRAGPQVSPEGARRAGRGRRGRPHKEPAPPEPPGAPPRTQRPLARLEMAPRSRGSGRARGGECEAAGCPSRSRAARTAPCFPPASPPLGGRMAAVLTRRGEADGGVRARGAPTALPCPARERALSPSRSRALHGHPRMEQGSPQPRLSGCPAALHTCVLWPLNSCMLRACGCSGSRLLRATACGASSGSCRDAQPKNVCFPRAGLRDCTRWHLRAFTMHSHTQDPLESQGWRVRASHGSWICTLLPVPGHTERHIPQVLGCGDFAFLHAGVPEVQAHTHRAPLHLPAVGSRHRLMETQQFPGWDGSTQFFLPFFETGKAAASSLRIGKTKSLPASSCLAQEHVVRFYVHVLGLF